MQEILNICTFYSESASLGLNISTVGYHILSAPPSHMREGRVSFRAVESTGAVQWLDGDNSSQTG